MEQKGSFFWHMMAIMTVVIWGTSFVSTKILLSFGFSAVFIFFVRFIVTYLLLVICCHKNWRAENVKDELNLLLGGLMGGTLYFWLENTALTISPSSNVSLIVCTNPMMILIAVSLLYKKERLNMRQMLGSLLTFIGMVLVVLNGQLYLNLSPVGDLMALGAAIVWVIYSISIRRLYDKYSMLFITRKIFFYSCLTTIPFLLYDHPYVPWENFSQPAVIINFLLLTMLSSLFGYLVWNKVLKQLGTVFASNYIYAIPLVTIITAVIVLNERITWVAIAGAVAIVVGMVMAEYRGRKALE